jgi:heat-inducible transcriptional repressor
MAETLNERQRTILQCTVGDYIASAAPIGSRAISRRHRLGLSPATIRNVMADLEDLGYVNQPHTSAGRMPTDKGYRYYVDELLELDELSEAERRAIGETLEHTAEPQEILTEASRILGKIAQQLSLVTSPHFNSAKFDRLELLNVSSTRILVVFSVESGIVKTITMEVATEVQRDKLDDLSRILNERLSGLTLQQVRETFAVRVHDVKDEETGIIRLLMSSKDRLFDDVWNWSHLHIGGATQAAHQPEFQKPERFRAFLSLVDDEEVMTQVVGNRRGDRQETSITIGQEHQEEKLREYSIVTSVYKVGDIVGTVGILGPTRMSYSKIIPLVDYMAKTIAAMLS